MIWILSLVILILVGGSLTDDCGLKEMKECRKKLLQTTYPKTDKDLLEICQTMRTTRKCLSDVQETCKGTIDAEERRHMWKAVDYLNTVCDIHNPTFKAISGNLECLKPVIENMLGEPCHKVEETSKAYISLLNQYLDDDDTELSNCLNWHLMDVKCQAITLGYHCGSDVRDAVEEIARNLRSDKIPECSAEHEEEVKHVYEAYEKILLERLSKNTGGKNVMANVVLMFVLQCVFCLLCVL